MYVIAFVLHLLDVWFRGLDGLYVFSVLEMLFLLFGRCCWGQYKMKLPSRLLTLGIDLVCWFWFVIELSVV